MPLFLLNQNRRVKTDQHSKLWEGFFLQKKKQQKKQAVERRPATMTAKCAVCGLDNVLGKLFISVISGKKSVHIDWSLELILASHSTLNKVIFADCHFNSSWLLISWSISKGKATTQQGTLINHSNSTICNLSYLSLGASIVWEPLSFSNATLFSN